MYFFLSWIPYHVLHTKSSYLQMEVVFLSIFYADALFPLFSYDCSAKSNDTMLNTSIRRRHPCLVPNLWRVKSLTIKCNFSSEYFCRYFFIKLRKVPCMPHLFTLFLYQECVRYSFKCSLLVTSCCLAHLF